MARVIVVDDNAVNRDLVVTLLGYKGHSVVQAADGVEALASARAEAPDLVLTDLLMPVMDGYELVREIRADPILADTPVIFYSLNYLEREVQPVAAALGVRHIVSKPIDPQHLLRTVDEALAQRGSAPGLPTQAIDREHLRTVSAKLVDKVQQLERAEQALRESEARFRTLAHFLPIGVFSLNADVEISYANPRMREICGLSDVPAADADWHALLHPDDCEAWQSQLRQAINERTSLRDRVRLIRPDGAERVVQVQVVPVTDRAESSMYVGTVEDITGVLEAQRQHDEMESRLRVSEAGAWWPVRKSGRWRLRRSQFGQGGGGLAVASRSGRRRLGGGQSGCCAALAAANSVVAAGGGRSVKAAASAAANSVKAAASAAAVSGGGQFGQGGRRLWRRRRQVRLLRARWAVGPNRGIRHLIASAPHRHVLRATS